MCGEGVCGAVVCACVCVSCPLGATENLLVYSLSQKLFACFFLSPSLSLSSSLSFSLSVAGVVLAYLFIVIACGKTTNKFLDSNFMQRAALAKEQSMKKATNVDLNLPQQCGEEGVERGGRKECSSQSQCIYL